MGVSPAEGTRSDIAAQAIAAAARIPGTKAKAVVAAIGSKLGVFPIKSDD